MTNRQIRIVLIILVILFLLFFGGRYLVMYLMQKGLFDGWIGKIEGTSATRIAAGEDGSAAKGGKITVPEGVKAAIKRNLEKLGFKDLNTLVKWSKLIQAQDFVGAVKMKKEVWPILSEKTDLADIKELQGVIIPG